jgi:hypothetical protein
MWIFQPIFKLDDIDFIAPTCPVAFEKPPNLHFLEALFRRR